MTQKLDTFDGTILHPSLDIRENLLLLGFSYRSQENKSENVFLIASKNGLFLHHEEMLELNGKHYIIDATKKKPARLDDRWDPSEINDLLEKFNDPIKYIAPNPKDVFESIESLIRRFVALQDENDYALLSAWIIATYFSPIFTAFPFLHIKAPKRSGKSQCLNLLLLLCFNAVKARPTMAAMCDTVDALRGTYLIDQADSLAKNDKDELLELLTDSYKKTGGKRRVVSIDKKRGGREVIEIDAYGPKAFASVKEVHEDLRDRCIIIPLIRSRENFLDPYDSYDECKKLRNEIYRLLIGSFDLTFNTYSIQKIALKNNIHTTLADTIEVAGRELELWLPIQIIMGLCKVESDKILAVKKRFLSQYGFSEYEPNEFEQSIIECIITELGKKESIILSPKEIASKLDYTEQEYEQKPSQQTVRVGRTIKKFNLASEKKRSNKGNSYVFEKKKVLEIHKSYFLRQENSTPPTPDPIFVDNPKTVGV